MTRETAVVFDFDGVLADTERLHLRAFQDAFAAQGWRLDEADYFSRYLGFDDAGLVAEFARDRRIAIDEHALARLLDDKARRFAGRLNDGQALFPTAARCVARVGATRQLAIASGALRREIEFVLASANLRAAFAAIVGADDVTRSKPAPDAYLEATRRLGVRPERAVAIEDSRWGLASATAAGLRTVAITTSCRADELQPADAIISSLDELTDSLIQQLL